MTRPANLPMCQCGSDHSTLIEDRYAVTNTGCWQWTGGITRLGYPYLKHVTKNWLAHRVSYWAYRGDFDSALTLDHLCRNRACVNPWHLEPVPLGENIRRSDLFEDNARGATCDRGHLYGDTERVRLTRRCARCTTEKRKEWEDRNPPLEPGDPRHGTLYAYRSFKCRCDPCRAERSRTNRLARERRLAREAQR